MAIVMIDKKWCPTTNDYQCDFIIDSASDAENLPSCCPGSTAIVADIGGAAYMVNASGEWREI